MLFKEFNLSPQILRALQEQKYDEASPIQEQAIPVILAGRDVLGCAQTGTGKTCAFMAPIIQKIIEGSSTSEIKSLIVCPTRELAIQIFESTIAYSKFSKIKTAVIYGGIGEAAQKKELAKGPDILIATPGRLLDFINQKIVDIKKITFFVLDEADRMLDMGFIHDIKKIITFIPQKRQTLLFSATMPSSIKQLCNQLLNNPVNITITPPSTTVEKINQKVYFVDKSDKSQLLIELLKGNEISSALVFSRTKHGANKIQRVLGNVGILAAAIHGNKSQVARQAALAAFKGKRIKVLVATDIASRGIDIESLSHVINYDLPDTTETYVHRIGRTARAGRSGEAITFCCGDEFAMLKEIERDCKVKFEVIRNHNFSANITTNDSPKQFVKNRSKK